MIRAAEIGMAILLGLLLAPILVLATGAVLCSLGRPVLYRSRRLGAGGVPFDLIKFRTMPAGLGSGVTGGHKVSRIGPIGQFMRRTRIDELPQLVNILRGDIGFVGPRPPLPQYADCNAGLQPGVTGLATLVFHAHEERLLARCRTGAETDACYRRRCLPRKARIDAIHSRNRSAAVDLWIVIQTCLRVVGAGKGKRLFRRRGKRPRVLIKSKVAQANVDQHRRKFGPMMISHNRISGGIMAAWSHGISALWHSRIVPGQVKKAETLRSPLDADRDWAAILGRRPGPDCQVSPGQFRDRVVLVSGAGGTIGAALCRHALQAGASRVIALENSEIALFGLVENRGTARFDQGRLVPVLGSVSDRALVARTLREEGVDTVLHTAAYKHVPMVQTNPVAGLSNNVLGTLCLAEAARACNVEHFLLVSTDKAARPHGVMGVTKRMAEIIVQDLAQRTDRTRFSVVRFGNVLGSSGSVVPQFEKAIANGGPVRVTHPAATRYFVTLKQAADLVLCADQFAQSGDVLMLRMGPPVKVSDLAQRMIDHAGATKRAQGRAADPRIEIEFTGLRPGESLHEYPDAAAIAEPTAMTGITRLRVDGLKSAEVQAMIGEIEAVVASGCTEDAISLVDNWRPRLAGNDQADAATSLVAQAVSDQRRAAELT